VRSGSPGRRSSNGGNSRSAAAQTGEIQRGKYLVEEVAKRPECHTPRDANGNLDPQAWLQGAPIWIMPVRHIANWADNVPAIAGLPSYTDGQMERVLEKGIGPHGEVLRPPALSATRNFSPDLGNPPPESHQ
jgi:hypothetical protein